MFSLTFLKELTLRRPREAYVRFHYYAAFVESIQGYYPNKEEDVELSSRLEFLDLHRNLFPNLKRVTVEAGGNEFWFPFPFRNHSVTDLSINANVVPRGCIKHVSQYCSRLEHLTVTGLLNEVDIDLLQVHRFIHLKSLSLYVDDTQVDNFMRIVLFISSGLTDLTLHFRGNVIPTITRRGTSFQSLKRLKLDGLSLVADSLETLPSAPGLQSLSLTSCCSDVHTDDSIRKLCAALEEYHTRSPFTTLVVDGTPAKLGTINSLDISKILDLSDNLKLIDISLISGPSSKLLFRPLGHIAWQHLQALTLIVGGSPYPELTLHQLLYIVSQACSLEKVTARVDFRMEFNLGLISRPVQGEDYRRVYNLLQDILLYITPSLRTLDFCSSILLDHDQVFLFAVLKEMTPNVSLSTRLLETLHWTNQETYNAAIKYVKQDRPTMVHLIAFLATRSPSSL